MRATRRKVLKPAAGRMTGLALPTVPATAATSAGIAVKMIFHETSAAWGMASLVGLLALLGVFAVSPEAQETLRLWISHRAEHRLAAAASFEIRRRIKAATCGKRWTRSSADDIRKAAATYNRTSINLPEIMRIIRGETPAGAKPELITAHQHGSHTAGDDVARGRLGIVQQRDQPEDQANPG